MRARQSQSGAVTVSLGITDAEQALIGSIDALEIVELASALIAAGGENPGDTERATAQVLATACRERGFDVELVEVAPDRPNVIATVGGHERPGVLFLGHSDVVPAGDGWSQDPFAAQVNGGRLFGRGACDMKGGLAAVVVAMSALRRSGSMASAPVSLACLVDEEDTGIGIRSFVRDDRPTRFAHCVVAEPTGLGTIVGCRGAANIDITVVGKSAHAGRPENGRNAIGAAGRIVALIGAMSVELASRAHPYLGAATWNIGTIQGGTGASTVAERCSVSADRRLLPGERSAEIAADLRRRISNDGIDTGGITVSVSVAMEMPGFVTDMDSDLVVASAEAVAQAGARGRTIGVWTASCDGGFIARDLGIDTIVLGPGDIETQAHQPNESVSVEQLCDSARAYALLASRMIALPAVP